MADSIEKQIFAQLKAILQTLPWVKTVDSETIRLLVTDFQEHEVPAIQFFDAEEVYAHEQARVKVNWSFTIELVTKSTELNVANQGDLFDKKQDIEELIGANVRLNLPGLGMIHIRYDGSRTDLMSVQPFLIAQMDFTALFYKHFTGDC